MKAVLAMLMLAVMVPLGPPAAAQTRTETLARGRAVAEAWCADCHVIGSARSASDAAPSFASIARRSPDETAQRHKDRMPNYDLSRAEVDAVVAHILSLRR